MSARFLFRYLVTAPVFLLAFAAQAEHPAREVTRQMEQGIIASMKLRGTVADEQLYQQVENLLVSTHDLSFILGLTMGRNWRKLDSTQQNELLKLFTELSVTTYLSRFRAFAGERFEFKSEEPINEDQYFVHSVLVTAKGEEITFDYHTRLTSGEWRIINIIANKVSDLALKRAEYSSLMREQGYNGLVAEMRRQIELNRKNISKNKKLKRPR